VTERDVVDEIWGTAFEMESGGLAEEKCSSGRTEGGRYRVKPLAICLDDRRAFKRVIRRAISRSELIEGALRLRLFRECCDLVRDADEEVVDELDDDEEPPLTCFAHLEIASSSLAAIAPMRPPAAREDEEEAEERDGVGCLR